jgi:hypothetical protein
MNAGFRYCATGAALALSGALTLTVAAQGRQGGAQGRDGAAGRQGGAPQNRTYEVTLKEPGGPAPRTADGHPDLTGTWWPNRSGIPHVENQGKSVDPRALRQFDANVTPEEQPSFQPWALDKVKNMTDAEKELAKLSVNCIPRGMPAIWLSNTYAMQFVQTPGVLVHLIELLNNFRVIHTDGRPLPKYPEPLFHGNSSGRWAGDTLVIDSIGFDERTLISNNGTWFHSDQLHVTERLSRPSKNYLQVQLTVDDPKVLTKPWHSAPRNWTLIDGDVNEYYCTDNPDVDEFQKIKQVEKAN